MASIEFSNESLQEIEFSDFEGLIVWVLDALHLDSETELSITFVDKDAIRELNKEWLDSDYPTDVLSFPMDELRPGSDTAGGMLGDLVLCPTVAAEQAETRGHTVIEELQMLTVHGMLHLVGYDHANPEDEQEMFALQNRLLKSWAVANNTNWVEHFGASTYTEQEGHSH